MISSFYAVTLNKFFDWAKANSLWYFSASGGCCADEVWNAMGCRYDLERFGCLPQVNPEQADLLIVSGAISQKAAPRLRAIYDAMLSPKYVLSIGSCANCGGMFGEKLSYCVVPGVNQIVPVDVYVPGCPPRPEAVMNGLIKLQEKISGHKSTRIEA